ncbi:mitochondrial carrier superfamily protein [Cystoisospora suis]|uniref:Mitochondrial carrier superfamily protein n=1 Tax=Cystoisospora suis TaxID=483139 RepID=A0A2C6KF03_9APIC|nr:mitochondrial carrier superfamily protein [Cystoisospora suis]
MVVCLRQLRLSPLDRTTSRSSVPGLELATRLSLSQKKIGTRLWTVAMEANHEFWVNFLAGGCTGLLVDAVLFPLDVFKTRKQAETSRRCQASAAASWHTSNAASLCSSVSVSSSQCPPESPSGKAPACRADPRSVTPSASASASSSTASSFPRPSWSSLTRDSGRTVCSQQVLPSSSRISSPSACSLSLPSALDITSSSSHTSHRPTSQATQTGHHQKISSNNSTAPARNPSRGLSSSTCVPLSVALDAAVCAKTNATSWTTAESAKAVKLRDILFPRNPLGSMRLGGFVGAGETHAAPRCGFLGALARRYYPGLAVLAVGTFPSSALFFVTYEGTKQLFTRDGGADGIPPAITYVACSTVAEFASCCVRTPFEMLKQQLQLGMHPSTMTAVREIYRRDRLQGFFVGFGATMVRDLPFVGVEMGLWEYLKKYFCSFAGKDPSHLAVVSWSKSPDSC